MQNYPWYLPPKAQMLSLKKKKINQLGKPVYHLDT